MSRNDVDAAQKQAWGALASDILKNWPGCAEAVARGVDCDPKALADAVQDPKNPACLGLAAIMNCIEQEFQGMLAWANNNEDEAKKEIDELKSTIAKIAKRALEQPGSGGGSARRKTTDPKKSFDGSEKDVAKRQEEYETFRSHINRNLTVDHDIFNTEFLKINYLAGLLTGDAMRNNQAKFDAVIEHADDPENWPAGWRTLSGVWSSLNKQYQTQDLARKAGIDYDNCVMKKRPFPDFFSEFSNLAVKCGKTAEQRITDLKLKVSSELNDASAMRPNKPGNSDYDGWVKRYQEIYDELEDAAHINKLRAGKGTNFRPQTGSPQSNTNSQQTQTATNPRPDQTADAMDLDAARMGRNRISREECAAKDLCFYCKERGHRKDECPAKKAADAKYGRHSQLGGGQRGGYYGGGRQPHPYNNQAQRSGDQFQLGNQPNPYGSRSQSPTIPNRNNWSGGYNGHNGYNGYNGGNFGNGMGNHPVREMEMSPALGGYIEEGSVANSSSENNPLDHNQGKV